MKAIQTEYNGYKFRSRLEARWAVFFSSLGINWLYEHEGFDISDGEYYLPDFYLPDIPFMYGDKGCYIEVKSSNNTNDDKWKRFGYKSDIPIMLVTGIPYQNPHDCPNISKDVYNDVCYWFIKKECSDGPYLFCECNICNKIGLQFDGRAGRNCNCTKSDKNYGYNTLRIQNAYKMARQARFEHGEVG